MTIGINRQEVLATGFPLRHKQRGVTLVELMIVLVIVAILSAVAYPSYTQFVVKSKRSGAQSMLLQVADRQQQFFMDNKRYTADMTDLGYPAASFGISQEGTYLSSGDGDSVYDIQLANATATTYELSAVPQGAQASHDTKCGTLTYNQAGLKGATGSVEDCW